MATITVTDLEVFYRVGVTEAERAHPQRLLLTVELEVDESAAAATDDLANTIDYYELTRQLIRFGEGRNWRLLERLAAEIADFILTRYRPLAVTVEVKKFVLPEARHVSVRVGRRGPAAPVQPG
ncbi:dihydroneopterin aldolase [Limisphaera sp. VF-2]|jgi:FolB domain-containing protein|uniref:dihydroneopterin aldolase n=1 Tax=Limisphaera sp. VF-2 TaxID=3400418 RepID=UPI001753E5EB|nr:dihydroneopterin aldolase [Limisphaera sp.]